MTTRTMKTLGAAALGVAFAAAAAGSASAAALPAVDALGTVGQLAGQLPTGQVTDALPGLSTATESTKTVLTGSGSTLPEAQKDPVGGLLGGLPVGGKQLPTGPISSNALPGGLLG
ncbi:MULTISPECIES: ATP-binding protein [unclassified Streptomyces]|uniref:ATP-binding protein n=1 Tax=unclassified Streptomyces TaxID=2593676 RepID=UPI0020348D78|nr:MULTISPECIES: ATP-binding protein [unclassified Streptomyces]MCM2421228.1 ATP-binding protein [Streptomyces sp. RKAG293]MCM2426570.1 ATP-binding protein [Streptomyces sp. RKAG337]